jgi:hypothetical protein
MWNRFALALVLALSLASCKDKAPKGEATEQTPEPVATTQNLDDASAPEEVAPPKLTETAQVLFEAATESSHPLQWELAGEVIPLRAEATKLEGDAPSYDARVMAQIKGDEEESEVFTCKGLKASAMGRIDLVLRGDKLHVLCIHPVMGDDPGSTEAARFAFDLGTRAFSPAGTYGGDGSLDLDSIDLDEGE